MIRTDEEFVRDYKGILIKGISLMRRAHYHRHINFDEAKRLIKFVVETVKDVRRIQEAANEIKARKRTSDETKKEMLFVLYEERFENFVKRTGDRIKKFEMYPWMERARKGRLRPKRRKKNESI